MSSAKRRPDPPVMTEQEWQELKELERRENRLMLYVAIASVAFFLLGLVGIWIVMRITPPA